MLRLTIEQIAARTDLAPLLQADIIIRRRRPERTVHTKHHELKLRHGFWRVVSPPARLKKLRGRWNGILLVLPAPFSRLGLQPAHHRGREPLRLQGVAATPHVASRHAGHPFPGNTNSSLSSTHTSGILRCIHFPGACSSKCPEGSSSANRCEMCTNAPVAGLFSFVDMVPSIQRLVASFAASLHASS